MNTFARVHGWYALRDPELATLEEEKSMPWGAVWDQYCESRGVPVGLAWLDAVKAHEHQVLAHRAA